MLDVQNSSFVEMSHDELVETDGGIIGCILVGIAAGYLITRFCMKK